MPEENKSNIYLFYGEDSFSLRRKIDRWKEEFAKKYSTQAITLIDCSEFLESEIIDRLKTHLTPSLFSSKKLIIVRDGLPKKAEQAQLAEFLLNIAESLSKDFFVIFWQSGKPDGRLGFFKKLMNKVNVNEFVLPHGLALNQWLKVMAQTLGANISDQAADKLAQFLGRDLFEEKKFGGRVVERKEAFDLWQAYSELQKLASFSEEIGPSEVISLVKPKVPDSVFNLTDELIARNQKGAFLAFENFLSSQASEEKSAIIKILGLLSEQIRSLLIVRLFSEKGLNNDQIAQKLGWSAGRVFITARNLKNASSAKLKKLLNHLFLIDLRIKSTDTNSKLDIDLFLTKATLN